MTTERYVLPGSFTVVLVGQDGKTQLINIDMVKRDKYLKNRGRGPTTILHT